MRPEPFFPSHHFGGPFWWPHLLGFGLMSLLWLGLLGLLIWALVRLARGRSRAGGAARFTPLQTYAQPQAYAPAQEAPWQPFAQTPASVEPSAIEILRQRYARGEIDAVTFQQMLERLQASYPSPSARPVDPAYPTGQSSEEGNGEGHPTAWLDPEQPAEPTDGTTA